MKNVLLLCLSPVKTNAQLCEYSYVTKRGETVTLSGYATNEAPAKSVIDGIHRQHRRKPEKLDRVVAICSDLARRPILQPGESSHLPITPKTTHIDFFRRQVNDFALSLDAIYLTNPITYCQIPVDNYTDSNQISVAAIAAAKEILAVTDNCEDKGIRLYIDYNGGQRYFSLMLLAIASLLRPHGVQLRKVLAMNYETRIDGKVQIQNLVPVFGCMDLITAINEYINYGRTRMLNQYFGPCQDPLVRELLKLLTDFAHDLLLCRTSAIERKKGPLMDKLVAFSESPWPETEDADQNAYRTLFDFVAEDIRREMEDLLCGSLPEMLLWCVNHDYLQQALTFFTELFPSYAWVSGILQPTEAEEADYLRLLEIGKEDPDAIRGIIQYPSECQPGSSAYHYCWFIKYLQARRDKVADLLPEDALICRCRARVYDAWRYLHGDQQLKKRLQKLKISDEDDINSAVPFVLAHLEAGARICSPRNVEKRALAYLLTVYFVIKSNRNATNHASEREAQWEYEDYIDQITACADELKRITS